MSAGYDPGISPQFDAPWMGQLQDLFGQIGGTAIIVCVLGVFITAIVWAVSKAVGSQAGQTVGGIGFLVAVGAAVLIGSASGLIQWASGINLF